MPPRSHDGVTRLRDVRSHCHHHAVGEILQEKQGGDSENGGRRSKNRIDQWRSGKLSTGSCVDYSVSRAFAFSFGVALSKSAHYANHAELSHSAQIDVEDLVCVCERQNIRMIRSTCQLEEKKHESFLP